MYLPQENVLLPYTPSCTTHTIGTMFAKTNSHRPLWQLPNILDVKELHFGNGYKERPIAKSNVVGSIIFNSEGGKYFSLIVISIFIEFFMLDSFLQRPYLANLYNARYARFHNAVPIPYESI